MEDQDTINMMRRSIASFLRQLEATQSSAASLSQWFTQIGGNSWLAQVPSEVWDSLGISEQDFRNSMTDLNAISNILGAAGLGDKFYEVQLIG